VSTTRTERFLSRLSAGQVLLADGATGTRLQSEGLEAGQAPETWVLEQPQRVQALHQGYVDAGSDILLTCTFGGTRFRLERYKLADRVAEVNRVAAELAREVAAAAQDANGREIWVAGDMGPTGELLAPLGPVSAQEVTAAYAQQAAALAEGGADFLLFETMSDLGEARAAIAGARSVSDLPIFCTFSFDTHGRTMMGTRPEQVAREIAPLLAGLGANCGRDPAEFAGFLQAMRRAAPQAPLWAKPNAGLPRVDGDRVIYDATPQYMAQIAKQMRDAGAQIIGGCCGTTPEHILAMREVLR
jgi:5-methyltetrahydrofolate--homocysteine methyltransferase